MKINYKLPATSKTVHFAFIINSFTPLTSLIKISILNVAGVLDLPMNVLYFQIYMWCIARFGTKRLKTAF